MVPFALFLKFLYGSLFFSSAYHGHLMSLIDISPYKFKKMGHAKKDYVHVVSVSKLALFNDVSNSKNVQH